MVSAFGRWVFLLAGFGFVMATHGPHTHRGWAFAALAIGALPGIVLLLLPVLGRDDDDLLVSLPPPLALAVVSFELVWITLLVWATGGVEHAYWTLLFAVVAAAAALLPPLLAGLFL